MSAFFPGEGVYKSEWTQINFVFDSFDEKNSTNWTLENDNGSNAMLKPFVEESKRENGPGGRKCGPIGMSVVRIVWALRE